MRTDSHRNPITCDSRSHVGRVEVDQPEQLWRSELPESSEYELLAKARATSSPAC